MRKMLPDLFCIMMTTDPDPDLAVAWMQKGAAAYLRKPFETDYLLELCIRARRERALLRVEDLLEKRTRELSASKRQYQTLVENLNEVIYRLDDQANITYVSPSNILFPIIGHTQILLNDTPEDGRAFIQKLFSSGELDKAQPFLLQ
ncbi:MAG: hypothetical protein R6U68_05785 [Desulfobacteraceae bacterium]